jgi:hypothetical protein
MGMTLRSIVFNPYTLAFIFIVIALLILTLGLFFL